MGAKTLAGGFGSAAVDAAYSFRGIMAAMARPGTIQRILAPDVPAPLSPAAAAVLLTLSDTDTPVYLAGETDCADVRAWLAFHSGAPLTGPSEATFAVGTWDALSPVTSYHVGTAEYPDRSATLVVECAELNASGPVLTGPGIKKESRLSLPEIQAFKMNRALYPLGIDFIFTCGTTCAALPRSTEVSECM
ncbi:MAG: phosphonate C-P lyase system protein PhnH [Pseudomonadota bacterium]